MALVNMAQVAAESTGIRPANEEAIMEELRKLDPKKAAVKLVLMVGRYLENLTPSGLQRATWWSGATVCKVHGRETMQLESSAC